MPSPTPVYVILVVYVGVLVYVGDVSILVDAFQGFNRLLRIVSFDQFSVLFVDFSHDFFKSSDLVIEFFEQ